MKVLVVGGGGREHALAWKLAGERSVTRVYCAPGNPGTAGLADNLAIHPTDLEALSAAARAHAIDLTVVGPELPLDRGLADRFAAEGLRVFGPSRAAAKLECSKVFAKDFMARHGVPTARYCVCDDPGAARGVVRSAEFGFPVVIKADGLAGGKGVVVAADRTEAEAAIDAALADRLFGDAGARIVIEECLTGPEVSFFAISDGERAAPLMSAQDHKRVFDDDRGPNTGGMGAFSPSPLMDAALEARVMHAIVKPVIDGLRAEGHPYRGFLYAGLMLTADGPKVIEFNVRFGDPEAQVILPRIAGDLAPRLAAAADGALDPTPLAFHPDPHVGVVVAARGYPASAETGAAIDGLEAAAGLDHVLVFHAGTAAGAGAKVVVAGGRVLTIVGRGATFADAIARAYDGVARVNFNGMHYRKDIGRKALHV
jgi:phosphoribosylamine---glycine ligase